MRFAGQNGNARVGGKGASFTEAPGRPPSSSLPEGNQDFIYAPVHAGGHLPRQSLLGALLEGTQQPRPEQIEVLMGLRHH
jgi:hypothetical protein